MLQVMAVARALVSSDEDVLEASTPHAVGQGGADEGRLVARDARAHQGGLWRRAAVPHAGLQARCDIIPWVLHAAVMSIEGAAVHVP